MAVKFKRTEDQTFDWNLRGKSFETIRRKTLLIYSGLAIAFFVALVVHLIGQGAGGARLMSSTEGSAFVLEKIIKSEGMPEPQYFLRCEVEVPFKVEEGQSEPDPASTTLSDLVLTDEASFDLVEEGGRVTVMYRVSGDYSTLRIHRMILNQIIIVDEP